MNRKHQLSLAASTILAASLAGCERGPELQPAAGAYEARHREAAATGVQDQVRVTAQAGEWPGDTRMTSEVTPLRVIIENGSGRPVEVRYSSFRLTAADGTTYHAIPPRQVPKVTDAEGRAIRPGFNASGFRTAPYFGPYFAGISPYDGTFSYDGDYYDTHYGYWQQTLMLPTREMLAVALPEGVIEPKGRLDGYLYFERVRQDDGDAITFRATLLDAERDRPLVSVELPFTVE